MKTPKTAEELFNKRKKLNWLHEYAENGIINEDDFIKALAEHDKERDDYNDERDSLIQKLSRRCSVLEGIRTTLFKLLDVTAIENVKKGKPRQFWVEIQNIPAESEPPEFIEVIYIQRNREDLDNLGEVFRVTEDLLNV